MKRSLLISAFQLFSISAFPAALSSADATNAVVGEAAGAPYLVKLGVAAAIYNRQKGGHPQGLHGVYGFNARHNVTEPAWVWRDAARAVSQCRTNDPTHGAVNFGNAADVQKGTFKGLHLTAVLGTGQHATYFFKR